MNVEPEIKSVDEFKFEPIKGFPMLNWKGKRPYTSTEYYPAQLKESYGIQNQEGWFNKIFWGDNLQVMSHLLKKFRGKINLIYIDPPFDSKADYKKKIKLKGKKIQNDSMVFEEIQYEDIWSNDEYLQFMYERLILLRELLAEDGAIYLHCDWHKVHHLRCIMDEIFGEDNFQNEIIWNYSGWNKKNKSYFNKRHDNILYYSKSKTPFFDPFKLQWESKEEYIKTRKQKLYIDEEGREYVLSDGGNGTRVKRYVEEALADGIHIDDVWEIDKVNNSDKNNTNYPTQKPLSLLERIILSSSREGDIVLDCFGGSGTTAITAMKNNRKFIVADINLGAIQTTTKRLLDLKDKTESLTGFEVYNVNHYDIFSNQSQGMNILLEALEINKFEKSNVFDGEKDGYLVKVMPLNRIATKADLAEIITNIDYRALENRKLENPNKPVENILLVCMGHETDLAANLKKEIPYNINVKVVDVLRDRQELEFKRDSEAKISCEDGQLTIHNFYPMNLLQKLSILKENVTDWKELVESVVIDWNFDGAVLSPTVIDIPKKNEYVMGKYEIPSDAGVIRIKITDLLSESLEVNIDNE